MAISGHNVPEKYRRAKLTDDTELTNVELCRAQGFDVRLFVTGQTYVDGIGMTSVVAPIDSVVWMAT